MIQHTDTYYEYRVYIFEFVPEPSGLRLVSGRPGPGPPPVVQAVVAADPCVTRGFAERSAKTWNAFEHQLELVLTIVR